MFFVFFVFLGGVFQGQGVGEGGLTDIFAFVDLDSFSFLGMFYYTSQYRLCEVVLIALQVVWL